MRKAGAKKKKSVGFGGFAEPEKEEKAAPKRSVGFAEPEDVPKSTFLVRPATRGCVGRSKRNQTPSAVLGEDNLVSFGLLQQGRSYEAAIELPGHTGLNVLEVEHDDMNPEVSGPTSLLIEIYTREAVCMYNTHTYTYIHTLLTSHYFYLCNNFLFFF